MTHKSIEATVASRPAVTARTSRVVDALIDAGAKFRAVHPAQAVVMPNGVTVWVVSNAEEVAAGRQQHEFVDILVPLVDTNDISLTVTKALALGRTGVEVAAVSRALVETLNNPACAECGGTDGMHRPTCALLTRMIAQPAKLPTYRDGALERVAEQMRAKGFDVVAMTDLPPDVLVLDGGSDSRVVRLASGAMYEVSFVAERDKAKRYIARTDLSAFNVVYNPTSLFRDGLVCVDCGIDSCNHADAVRFYRIARTAAGEPVADPENAR